MARPPPLWAGGKSALTPCLGFPSPVGAPAPVGGCKNSTCFQLGAGGGGGPVSLLLEELPAHMLPGALAGRGKRGSKPASGRRRRWKLDPGSADCLIYFKIKQMAAAGVCLGSAPSRARGQEPRGSCARNFSMTLVVKPPLPSLLNWSLTTHMSAAARARLLRAARLRPAPRSSLCLAAATSVFVLLSRSGSGPVRLPLSGSLWVSSPLPFAGNLPTSPARLPGFLRRLPPPAPGTWENSQPLWPLSVLRAAPCARHCGWEHQAPTVESWRGPALRGQAAQLPPGAWRPGGPQLSPLGGGWPGHL